MSAQDSDEASFSDGTLLDKMMEETKRYIEDYQKEFGTSYEGTDDSVSYTHLTLPTTERV